MIKDFKSGKKKANGEPEPYFFQHARGAGILVAHVKKPIHPLSCTDDFKRPLRVPTTDDAINYLIINGGEMGMSHEEYIDIFNPELWRKTRNGALEFGT